MLLYLLIVVKEVDHQLLDCLSRPANLMLHHANPVSSLLGSSLAHLLLLLPLAFGIDTVEVLGVPQLEMGRVDIELTSDMLVIYGDQELLALLLSESIVVLFTFLLDEQPLHIREEAVGSGGAV